MSFLWLSCRSALVARPVLRARRPMLRDAESFPSAAALVRGSVVVRPLGLRSVAVPACAAFSCVVPGSRRKEG